MNIKIPVEIERILQPFVVLFTKPVWQHVQLLLVGAILAPGKRTVFIRANHINCQSDRDTAYPPIHRLTQSRRSTNN